MPATPEIDKLKTEGVWPKDFGSKCDACSGPLYAPALLNNKKDGEWLPKDQWTWKCSKCQ